MNREVRKFNPDEISDNPRPPIDNGNYRLVVTDAQFGTSQKGNPKVTLEFDAEEAANGADLEDFSTRIRYQTLSFDLNSLWKVKNFCSAAGVPFPTDDADDTLTAWADNLRGMSTWGQVEKRRKNGSDREFAEVTRYLSAEEAKGVSENGASRRRGRG